MRDNIPALERISEYLLEKENITGKEFMQLMNAEHVEVLGEVEVD